MSSKPQLLPVPRRWGGTGGVSGVLKEVVLKKILFTGLLAALLSAVSAQAIQLNPSRQEVLLSVGENAIGQVEATNDGAKPVIVEVSARNWFVLPHNEGLPVESWLSLRKTKLELAPGAKQVIQFDVRIPTAAPKGGTPEGVLVGMVSFMPREEDAEPSSVNLVVSVSVYAIVKGTEKREAEADRLVLRKDVETLQAVVNVKNTGNVHARPSGVVQIMDTKNNIKAEVPLQEGRPVYPGNNRDYSGTATWPALKSGNYKALVLLNLWGKTLEKPFYYRVKKGSELESVTEEKGRRIWEKNEPGPATSK